MFILVTVVVGGGVHRQSRYVYLLFDAGYLLSVEEAATLVLQSVLPTATLCVRVHHKVVTQVS